MGIKPFSNRLPQAAAEAAGTFLLVFVGAGAIVLDEKLGGTLGYGGIGAAFGIAVFTAIFIFGRASGAHINPAVTLGVVLLRRLPSAALPVYWAAQLSGAAAAAALLTLIPGVEGTLGATTPSGAVGESLFIEVVLTVVLMSVVAGGSSDTALSRATVAAIVGATVAVLATIGGPISGASMNPARSFGPAIASGVFDHHWVYWVGPMIGASIASLAFRRVVAHLGKATAQ